MTGVREITVVLADPGFAGQVPSGSRVSVVSPADAGTADVRSLGANLFVLASAGALQPVADLVRAANSVHVLRAVFLRADVDEAWLLPMLERASLRTLRNMVVHASPDVPERIMRAWQFGAQDRLVADATVAGDLLLVRSCALELFAADFAGIPALARLPRDERPAFRVDSDGSYLHWDHGDTHVGMDTIRYLDDPDFKSRIDLRRLAFDRRFGAAVKALRLRAGLRQSDVPGLSARQVSRIEAGSGVPRLDSIRKLAAAQGMRTSDFLDEISAALADPARLAASFDPR